MGEVSDKIFFRKNENMPDLRCEFGCDHDLASAIEYGSPTQQARPFIQPTLMNNAEGFLKAVRDGFLEAIRNA